MNCSRRVKYDVSTPLSGITLREGNLECDALILEEGKAMLKFQDIADSIKENYGFHNDLVASNCNIPFDDYRHPCFPDDAMVYFPTSDDDYESMWVAEKKRTSNGFIGTLLNDPFNESINFSYGDMVEVKPIINRFGQVIPVAFEI